MDGQHTRFTGLRRFFAGLTTGQKLAATTIVAVMTASALWLNGRAPQAAGGAGGMQPVLDQLFTPAQLVAVIETLQARSIPHETRDRKVYVPAERRLDALSDLYYADALRGAGTEDGFDALVKQMSAWDPPSKTDKLYNHHRQLAVQRVIAGFDGVRKATVIIDPSSERRMNGASIHPTAMVDIQTRGGGGGGGGDNGDHGAAVNPRRLASAAVNVLVGSLANLSRERVTVTVDGASYSAGAGADAFAEAGDVLERRQRCEQAYVAKVRQLLSYIPDVLVSVSVDLNAQSLREERRISDPEKQLHNHTGSETPTKQAEASDAHSEPRDAVVANAVPMIAGMVATATPTTATIENAQPPRAAAQPPAGRETVRSAAIAVPRSYFVQVYKRASSNKSAEPSDALLQPVVDARAAQIRGLVRNALGLESDDAVTVEAYDDALSSPRAPPPIPGAVAGTAGAAIAMPVDAGTAGAATAGMAATPAALLLNAHAREIALVTLGIVALLMTSMILRRQSAPVPAPLEKMGAAEAVAVAPHQRSGVLTGTLEDSPSAAAGAGTGNGTENRDGSYFASGTTVSSASFASVPDGGDQGGEDEPDAHQMFRRVRDMACENPDDAARVLREWIYQSQGQGR